MVPAHPFKSLEDSLLHVMSLSHAQIIGVQSLFCGVTMTLEPAAMGLLGELFLWWYPTCGMLYPGIFAWH